MSCTMKPKPEPPIGTKPPKPLYSCSEESCAEEQTYPADDLYWVPEWNGWYCSECIWGRESQGGSSVTVGVSLGEWLLNERQSVEPLLAQHRENDGRRHSGSGDSGSGRAGGAEVCRTAAAEPAAVAEETGRAEDIGVTMSWKTCLTNFPHPSITTGQHTNGPARVWVEVDGEWVDTGSHRLHAVMRELETNGVARIVDGTWDEYEPSPNR